MSEIDDPIADSGPDIAVEQGAEAQTQVDPGPELDSLLAEFDRSKEGGEKPQSQTSAKSGPTDFDVDSRYLQLAMQSDQQRDLLARLLQSNYERNLAHQHQEMVRQENADFEEVITEANEYLEGLPVTEDYAKRWFLAEVQLNPTLREVWEHRRDSPELHRHAIHVIRREMKKMRAQVSRIPDRDATEDRAAVTAAVRGGSKAPPAETSDGYRQRVGRMTDTELSREFEKFGV